MYSVVYIECGEEIDTEIWTRGDLFYAAATYLYVIT